MVNHPNRNQVSVKAAYRLRQKLRDSGDANLAALTCFNDAELCRLRDLVREADEAPKPRDSAPGWPREHR